ncbi:hypothetical protein K443DRAFT_639351 [Laccaria amethystina LaAM-08-1]|uniref:Uncharacterized protein n=1 Tax=Laccaria amethystina LaAM-08-1 TaxID=1095629 RepID=A0A0C9Y625_9AGAR|nr:hypothetical protein K443DRAFT_639351 [Laccaria amethystina LaAM-08-1]
MTSRYRVTLPSPSRRPSSSSPPYLTKEIGFRPKSYDPLLLTKTELPDGQFNYTCSDVTPYSDIYFYQLASSVASNKTWSTRFTIASPKGASVAPSNATPPDGIAIPWGRSAQGSLKGCRCPQD